MSLDAVLQNERLWHISTGDCRELLRALPAESVHCVVTSPPYWGLRDYGLPPLVWGEQPGCEHDWTADPTRVAETTANARWQHEEGGNGNNRWQATGDARGAIDAARGRRRVDTSTCARCGAWRGQLGLEPTPQLYVEHMVQVFSEVHRVLRSDGVMWLNLGDSYAGTSAKENVGSGIDPKRRFGRLAFPRKPAGAGLKPKDLVGAPWRVALALQDAGWWLRSDVVWHKPNPMPEAVTDRPTRAHEYVFQFAKAELYFFDNHAVKEPWVYRPNDLARAKAKHPGYAGKHQEGYAGSVKGQPVGSPEGGRNVRSVWTFKTEPFAGAHFATFPTKLAERCILAGSGAGGACRSCGSPLTRRLGAAVRRPGQGSGNKERKGHHQPMGRSRQKGSVPWQPEGKPTVGWVSSCDCTGGGPPVPCVVLDPFAGAATTGLVALQQGRRFIGCELNPEYVSIGEKRLGAWRGQQRLDQGLARWEAIE